MPIPDEPRTLDRTGTPGCTSWVGALVMEAFGGASHAPRRRLTLWAPTLVPMNASPAGGGSRSEHWACVRASVPAPESEANGGVTLHGTDTPESFLLLRDFPDIGPVWVFPFSQDPIS